MSVLQRLEQQARAARQGRAAAADARQAQVAATVSRISPALQRAEDYLQAFCAHLDDLELAPEVRYPVDGVGEFEDLEQGPCRMTRDATPSERVQLRFECTGPNPIEARIDGHARAEKLARDLRDLGLGCHTAPLGAKAMRLRVDPSVPVRIRFTADVERGQVQLELRNLETLGVIRYALAPERIDDELLDAVASLVLREPSRLAELTGSVVATEDRIAMQRRLAREQRRRDAELAGGMRWLLFPLVEWFRRRFTGR